MKREPHPTDHEYVPDAEDISMCGICGWEEPPDPDYENPAALAIKPTPTPQVQEAPSGAPAPAEGWREVVSLLDAAEKALSLCKVSRDGLTLKMFRECLGAIRKASGALWDLEVNSREPAPAAPEAGAPGTRKPTRVVRNHEGERCAVCDATYDHFHGYDAHGEVPGKFDGSDWDLTTLPRPGAPGTQGATLCECPCGCKRPADSLVIVGGRPAYRECDWCDNCQHAEDKSVHRPPTQTQEGGSQP